MFEFLVEANHASLDLCLFGSLPSLFLSHSPLTPTHTHTLIESVGESLLWLILIIFRKREGKAALFAYCYFCAHGRPSVCVLVCDCTLSLELTGLDFWKKEEKKTNRQVKRTTTSIPRCSVCVPRAATTTCAIHKKKKHQK